MAEQLTWHYNHRSQDGKMRHPVDYLVWKNIDNKWPNFASEPRNLRLGLSLDGFNPFGDFSSRYSYWPVILMTYNLPPSLCMSKENMMLTLLIPGPKQLGNDIDVYLQPLIEDLKELWVRVSVYDEWRDNTFSLKAVLMWTINDFPAYGNLSGYSTKGRKACLVCGVQTCSQWLENGKKHAYMGDRRWLPEDDPFRFKASWFDGTEKHRAKPIQLTGSQVFQVVKDFVNDWGKEKKQKDGEDGKRKRKRQRAEDKTNDLEDDGGVNPFKLTKRWKKRSIFFDLPYWEALLLHHNLDMMHTEKNICESLLGTLLNMKGKTKHNPNSRKDLKKMGIRKNLHLKNDDLSSFKGTTPAYVFLKGERFMKTLKDYVKNRSNPEECIAEKYLAEELTKFCSGYFTQAADVGVQHKRNEDLEDDNVLEGRGFGGKSRPMTPTMLQIAHRYVLMNTIILDPWRKMLKDELKLLDSRLTKNESLLDKKHMKKFSCWLSEMVRTGDSADMPNIVRWLACGPRREVKSCSSFIINGNRFHTKAAEKDTQNSGVFVERDMYCRASAKDTALRLEMVDYYGVIREIILLDYHNFKVPLFHCDWANISNCVKVEDGFTLVNLNQGKHQFERDLFIFASQAKQVFYSRESKTSNWYVVLRAPPRGFYENENLNEVEYIPCAPFDVSQLGHNLDDDNCLRRDSEDVNNNASVISA
ncbi:uncharacterized protein LOC112203559 [Rosa chinensis]|uniref:uncharacterized protein LOC112203559 n=1 Tax=Rosa chinensis TaxID=74649 RepID=UPI000D094344|nr:uncharacterized protein LOC112203559 [Rosa chinensis]